MALILIVSPPAGEVLELPEDQRFLGNHPYRPKMPLPRECINKIDAGFLINGNIYLISNTFVWKFDAERRIRVGYPRRLSDVFAGWNFITRAAFVGRARLKLSEYDDLLNFQFDAVKIFASQFFAWPCK